MVGNSMKPSERLVFVLLNATDLEQSIKFYRDIVGIPLEPSHNEPNDDPWMGGHHAEFSWRQGAYLHFSIFPARPPHDRRQLGWRLDSW
jgi:catechol 2,3-dioxygenase-like lactoylglutathione lyase family enzyme